MKRAVVRLLDAVCVYVCVCVCVRACVRARVCVRVRVRFGIIHLSDLRNRVT